MGSFFLDLRVFVGPFEGNDTRKRLYLCETQLKYPTLFILKFVNGYIK